MNLKPSGSGNRGWYLFTHIKSYEYSLAKMRGKNVFTPQNLKNISKLSFTHHTSSLPLWRGWYFFTEAREIFSFYFSHHAAASPRTHMKY